MNYSERPTELQEAAAIEMNAVFAEHLKQFKSFCDTLHNIESNLETIGNEAFKTALLSPGRIIQTDDGAEWQHDLDLTKAISVCHRRTAAGLEFAVVECLPLTSGERKEVLNSGYDAREVLQTFAHDQRQILKLWKDDLTMQAREQLEQKYPQQDMNVVAESFEYKLACAIPQRPSQSQNQSCGMRI